MTRYEPGVTDATTNDPVKVPSDTVQLCVSTTVPLSVQEVSLDEKPVPDTETVVATLADVGLKVRDNDGLDVSTVSVADAESPSGMPVAVTVYAPTPTFAIVKEPVNAPSEIEHASEVTGEPVSKQEVSAVLKPVPDTSTTAPDSPEDGINVIWRPVSPTAKVADAESPLGRPVTMTGYSEAATFATTNEADRIPSEIEQVDEVAALLDT